MEYPEIEEVVAKCSDPTKAVFVSMSSRIGILGWMTHLEYTFFRPDTPENRKFELTVMKWPGGHVPNEFSLWVVVVIPRSHEKIAKKLLWQHGLRVAGSNDPSGEPYTFIMFDEKGKHKFPIYGDNVFPLENHSDKTEHVAYTNDQEKIKAARAHEDEIVKRFHHEHEIWLFEHWEEAEKYWAEHPEEFNPAHKPEKPTVHPDFYRERGGNL